MWGADGDDFRWGWTGWWLFGYVVGLEANPTPEQTPTTPENINDIDDVISLASFRVPLDFAITSVGASTLLILS
ncbi:hypothetical protein QYF36_016044 [Acer negundo]|nr:hypothetical protein QYF36_016044 [Acer negundo]